MTIVEKQRVKQYHTERHGKWGDDRTKILGWTSKSAQEARFKVIASLVCFNGVSVLDLGCGDGDLKYFLSQRFSGFDYIGLDQQVEFIDHAKHRFKDWPNTWFHHTDFTLCQLPKMDVVVACGSLSYRSDNYDYYMDRVRQFYGVANDTFIFNMLDRNHFESGPLLISHDKEQMYGQCREICNDVTLETGYLDNDFTIKMQKP